MPAYRLFMYNAQNHIVDHAVIEVADDQAAFDHASQVLSYRDIEIWQGRASLPGYHATEKTRLKAPQ